MKPLPASHSSLERFSNCPKQFHEIKVLRRVQDPPNEASLWGNRVHEGIEQALRNNVALPQYLQMYSQYVEEIRAVKGEMYVEVELAINTRLEPCAFDAPGVFFRAIADVLHLQGHRALVMDHKTGKPKEDPKQLKRTAILVFHTYPNIDVCKTGYFWLKSMSKTTDIFYREQLPKLWAELLPDLKEYKKAFDTDTWQPRQSGLCHGWCPVSDCEYWKPKGASALKRR